MWATCSHMRWPRVLHLNLYCCVFCLVEQVVVCKKCFLLSRGCLFALLFEVCMCHGRSVGEYFVKYKEQWKNVESQAQNWTKVR